MSGDRVERNLGHPMGRGVKEILGQLIKSLSFP